MDSLSSDLTKAIQDSLVAPYKSFADSMHPGYQIFISIFVYVILIMLYSVFVYVFSKFLGRKNIIHLNLSQYNTQPDSSLKKFFAAVFYLLEYIIILPVLVFFGFTILSLVFILFSSDENPVSQIFLISAALVGAVRITSYFKESLSKELAKLVPFGVLIIFLLSPDSLKISSLLEKFIEIPSFLTHIFYYLGFVICFEIIIRAAYTVVFLSKRPEEQEIEEAEEAFKEQEDD